MATFDRLCRAWVCFSMRCRGITLTAVLLLTCAFGIFVSDLRIHSAFADLLPQAHPYVKVHNEFHTTFGGGNLVLVALEAKNGTVFNPTTLKKIEAITETIETTMDGVDRNQIFSIAHRKAKTAEIAGTFVEQKCVMWPTVPSSPEEICKIQERVGSSTLLCGPFVSSDHTSVLITAQFHDGKIDYRKLFWDFKQIIDQHTDADHAVYVAGVPMLVGWGYFYMKEILLAFALTMAVMVFILFSYFRSWQGVVVPLFAAVVSAIWGLGFASLLKINLDPLILVVPMLVSARALSHSVQFMEKFYETLRVVGDRQEAAKQVSLTLFAPGFLGIGTDALGILLIALSTIPLMQKLAYFCSFWAASILLTVLVLNPILLSYLPAPRRVFQTSSGWFCGLLDRLLSAVASLSLGRARWSLITGAVLLAIGSYVLSTRMVVGDLSVGSGILRTDSHYDQSLRRITEKFFGASPLFIFVRGKEAHTLMDPEVARTVERFQRVMEENPNVKGSVSYVDLIRYFHEVMREGDPKWSLLPRSQHDVGSLMSCIADTSQPGDIERFLTMNYQHAVIQIFFKDTRGTTVTDAIARAKAFIDAHPLKGAEFALAGGVVGLKAAVNEEVAYSNDLTFALILGSLFIWSTLTYRSITIGLLLTLCTALSNYLVFALMVLSGIELNIHTLPVSSIGMGVGIDYGYYLVSRLTEEYPRFKNMKGALRESILTSGKAIFLTASMLVCGVVLWDVLTHVRFIGEMGLLLGLLILFNMLIALSVLPAILTLLNPSVLHAACVETTPLPEPAPVSVAD